VRAPKTPVISPADLSPFRHGATAVACQRDDAWRSAVLLSNIHDHMSHPRPKGRGLLPIYVWHTEYLASCPGDISLSSDYKATGGRI